MGTQDGHRVMSGPGGREGLISCSRWEELGDALAFHGGVASALGVPFVDRTIRVGALADANVEGVCAGDTEGVQRFAAMDELSDAYARNSA